jgi:cytochrome c oxidase cbb3-type subunit 2
MYDHPFQWGSKRTGPDLARVGARYSDEWHVAHLINPRAVVPESVMPGYGFLARQPLEFDDIAAHLRTNRTVGVPYSDDMIKNAKADLAAQTSPDADTAAFAGRYPKAQVRKFNAAEPRQITEMDALVAYLQMLGTLVDFTTYDTAKNIR